MNENKDRVQPEEIARPTVDPKAGDRGNPRGTGPGYSGQEYDSGSGPASDNERHVEHDAGDS